jgi:segregation and condensation protein A
MKTTTTTEQLSFKLEKKVDRQTTNEATSSSQQVSKAHNGQTIQCIFEGPLDLMLSLISKHKLNIQDIEISVLLEQFMKYIESLQENDIEVAGEFLEMAAHLIYIKSVSLLPKHEAEQLKKELEGALIEYELCKATAVRLREVYIGDLLFCRAPMEVEVDLTYRLPHSTVELIEASYVISDRDKLKKLPPVSSDINPAMEISYVSVFSKILYVLKTLKRLRKGGSLEIKPLFSGQTRSEKVATFMALLELSSHGRIAFSENSEHIVFQKTSKGKTK